MSVPIWASVGEDVYCANALIFVGLHGWLILARFSVRLSLIERVFEVYGRVGTLVVPRAITEHGAFASIL